MSGPTVSYANVVAGSKLDSVATSSPTSTVVAAVTPTTADDSETPIDSNPKDFDKSSGESPSSSHTESSETAEAKKDSKKVPAKKSQLNLAPAPVPQVSAWGAKAVVTPPTESPLAESIKKTEQAASKNKNKLLIAKNTGKEKWVPIEASVVISNPGKSGKSKRSNKKKSNNNANNTSNNTNNNANNNSQNEKSKSAKLNKRKVSAEKKDFTKSEKQNESKPKKESTDNTTIVTTSTSSTTTKSADSASSTANSTSTYESLKLTSNGSVKQIDSTTESFKSEKLNGSTEYREHHQNGHFSNGGQHFARNARYVRSNYTPNYRGNKPHNKPYYNNNANNNNSNGSEFKNSNGFVPFKHQQMQFMNTFIPQPGFKQQVAPYMQYYPPYGDFYNNSELNMMGPSHPIKPGKNFNQQKFFNQPTNIPQYPINGIPLANDPLGALIHQISYYFSIENLSNDLYLRRQMNSEGYLPVSIIANFRKVTYITTDYEFVLQAIKEIEHVEIKGEKVRLKNNYKQFVLPMSERDLAGKDEEKEENKEEEVSN